MTDTPSAPAQPAKKSGSGKKKWIIIALVLIAVAVGAWLALRQTGPDPILFTNGFEFPVTVTVTDDDGDATVIEVPAKGRTGARLAGKYTIKIVNGAGKTLKEGTVKFKDKDKQKERCPQIYNVLGSAAVWGEKIVFGMGIKNDGRFMGGQTQATICYSWGFDEKPPEAISTKKFSVGKTLTWLHYVGDGDWHTSIETLLAKKPDIGDQTRIRAWNLAVAVHKYDPDNTRLAALGPKFKRACHQMYEMFKTGPMKGQNRRKCLASHKSLFGG